MEELFQEAEKLFRSGQYEKAEKIYSEFIESVHSSVQNSNGDNNHIALRGVDDRYQALLTQALNNRGQIKYLRVDFDEAIEDYSAALNIDQDFAIGYYNRGQIHYRLGRYTQGIEDFNKALALKSDFLDAQLALKTAIEEQRTSASKN